jgi:predicted pyridoxine 5'-phosphate oxidase superfamily flavin-nucleotide-binding protein
MSRAARGCPAAVTLALARHLKGMDAPFHAGELEMQRRAGVVEEARRVAAIIAPGLPAGAGPFLARQRLAVAATLEPSGRVWASLLTGPPGFLAPVGEGLVRIGARWIPGDPLLGNLAARPELGLLAIDPSRRQRMRFNGRGMVSPQGVFLLVDRAYANCTRFIQRRRLVGEVADEAVATRVGRALTEAQQEWIASADTLFVASAHPEAGADASHRGGFPGFARVVDAQHLVFEDYPGNAMFNTLGNLQVHPYLGLLFVDFAGGGVLQVSGRARVGADRSVEATIEEVRETPAASPLRFDFVDYSPANPPLTIQWSVPSRSTTERHSMTESQKERTT